jgi:general secretion pathway protein B
MPTPAPAAPAPAAPVAESAPPATEAPKLKIQVVLYSDDPAERMVIIDGRRYAEGQKLDPDTVIERITPDGAVISRRGQRFPLTSGRP